MRREYKYLMLTLVLLGISTEAHNAKAMEGSIAYHSSGVVEFIPDTDPTDPVDPTDPNHPTHPVDPTDPDGPEKGTPGPLSIDFASSLDFGKNKISNKDEIYYAEPQHIYFDDGTPAKDVSNYVQVSDKRGTNAGWSLKVKQEKQLFNKKTQNQELVGAQIRVRESIPVSNQLDTLGVVISTPRVVDVSLVPGSSSLVMNAPKGTGSGTWLDVFGKLKTLEVNGKKVLKDTGVSLSIPGSTPKDAVQYKSKLTWQLSDTPSN